ncbi:MAG: hydrogenase maturation nickel metallochaperone HypA [Holophagae bacterium]|nr:MAG: hydrogenase maturation nickel metallochaperone HypA [Holophagae bacterium]
MGIALEIHRVCRDAARQHGPGRIESVRVAVGELTAVEPELLRFAWEAVVAGGRHAGSTLDVVWCPATQLCSQCGDVKDRAAGSWLRICPACGRPLEVTGGDELDVLELRFTPDDDAGGAPADDPRPNDRGDGP